MVWVAADAKVEILLELFVVAPGRGCDVSFEDEEELGVDCDSPELSSVDKLSWVMVGSSLSVYTLENVTTSSKILESYMKHLLSLYNQ